MKLGLINSLFLGTEIDPYTDGIRVTKEIGFDTIDIYPADGEMTREQIENTKRITDEVGLPIRSVPLILFGLFDPNKSARQHARDIGRRIVDLAAELGADNVLLVNGEYFWQLETGFTKEWIWNNVVEGTREIGEYAKDKGVRIAIELEPFKMSIIRTIDTMDEFLKAVNLPDTVLANIDCSHLYLADTPPEAIQKLEGRIAHVHFSDAREQHGDLPPGRGNAPLKEYLRQLDKVNFDGSVTIELEWPPDPSRQGVIDWATEAYEKTNEMMQDLGVRG
ncbi:MAG: sugar phosphate isomerase/epimerase [Chloroflexota bacterium]|nr:sugar phosphate isomerase/epimerase [Chloroflexota bacterium]